MLLVIVTNCRRTYVYEYVSNVRESKSERKRELRWTNAHGEARSMARCFIRSWWLTDAR